MGLVALRDIPLGDHAVKAGDSVPTVAVDSLPRGRLAALKSGGYLEERTDADLDHRLAELEKRVGKLERRKVA